MCTLQNISVVDKAERVHRFIVIEPDIILYFFTLNGGLRVLGFCQIDSYGLFNLALYRIFRFGSKLRKYLNVDTRFLENLSYCGLFKGFTLFNMTFREAPMRAASVFDKQISDFIIDSAVNDCTAGTLVKTFELAVSALFGEGNGIFNLIGYESHAFGSDNIHRRASVIAFNGGDNSAVKGSYRMRYAHDICTGRNAVISLFSLDDTEIKLINKSELSVYGADRVSDPYSDILAEHFNHTFRTVIATKILYG